MQVLPDLCSTLCYYYLIRHNISTVASEVTVNKTNVTLLGVKPQDTYYIQILPCNETKHSFVFYIKGDIKIVFLFTFLLITHINQYLFPIQQFLKKNVCPFSSLPLLILFNKLYIHIQTSTLLLLIWYTHLLLQSPLSPSAG